MVGNRNALFTTHRADTGSTGSALARRRSRSIQVRPYGIRGRIAGANARRGPDLLARRSPDRGEDAGDIGRDAGEVRRIVDDLPGVVDALADLIDDRPQRRQGTIGW